VSGYILRAVAVYIAINKFTVYLGTVRCFVIVYQYYSTMSYDESRLPINTTVATRILGP